MDNRFKWYRRIQRTLARAHVPGENLDGVSVAVVDIPKLTEPGGLIAVNPDNTDDKWYISREYAEANLALDEE